MGPNVIIHQNAGESQVPLTKFSLDWFGSPARHTAHFGFKLVGKSLFFRFRAEKSAECDRNLARGQFVSELWRQDVAEFFVRGPGPSYQEFNISPTGAWWSARFGQYRTLDQEIHCSSVSIQALVEDHSWEIEFSVPLSEIVVLKDLELRFAKLNPVSILCPQDPEYLCYGHTSGGEPDFHLSETFCPITLL